MFKLSEIIKATKGKSISKNSNIEFKDISTDSRSINRDSLFIPLVGKNYDGHKFIADAFRKGAKGTLISKKVKNIKIGTVIKVKNTEEALQNIALYHREKYKIPIIGVTGSSGKTTTKEMIASILSQELKTLKSNENYNNEIGVPITLLKLDKTHKAAVLELAMQKLGEIEELAKIILPNVAVITNVGEAHIKFLKTRSKVAKAKSEILKFLKRNDFAVLPTDDDFYTYLKNKAKCKIISFGINNKADVFASEIKFKDKKIYFTLNLSGKQYSIKLKVPGIHNIYNALASTAAASAIGIRPKSIIKGLQQFKASSKRMEISVTKNGVRIINDTYNANPSSMKAAIEVLKAQGPVNDAIPPRRIAVLGDMLELGRTAKSAHRSIVKLIAKSGIEILITRGALSKQITLAAQNTGMKKAYCFKTNKSAAKKLGKFLKPNDVVLVKGSRGMRMEEIVDAIKT